MALTDESNGTNTTMLVQPTGFGGNGGFGDGFGSGWWIILLLLCLGNGMWGGFGGGMWPMMMGGMGMDGLYPWLNNSQNINGGFRDQMLQSSISGLQNAVTAGFGDVQLGIAGVNQNICQTGNGIVAAVTGAQNALASQLYGNTIADMERSFAAQTATMQGFNGVTSGVADLKYTVATEGCNDRAAISGALNSLLTHIDQKVQGVQDKLCQLELDGYKRQVADEQRENANLRTDLMYARNQADRVAQTAAFGRDLNTAANGLVTELRSCPIPSQPVYGNQPIFTCQNNGYTNPGCGCNNFGVAA